MFRAQPDQPLPADLVPDDATAWAYAFGLQPTVAPAAAPATVTAQVGGQGLFVRVVVDAGRPASERELLGDLARATVIRLLREGTAAGGWSHNATDGRWTARVHLPDEVRVEVPDHVPDEWTRAA